MIERFLLAIALCGIHLVPDVGLAADAGVDYLKQIKPLLRERCYGCHGALKREAGLRLDTVKLMLEGGDSGTVISRGNAAKSLIVERVAAKDATERMPPEHEGEPLTSEQVKLLRDWIEIGAPAPKDEQPEADPKDHWAFRPVTRPQVPTIPNSVWVRNPIDAFLAQQHRQQRLNPQAEAPRILLLRRLYLDLIGMPPSAEEISATENDQSPDWYEKTVKRLLDDAHHGERWARHWMDTWRYSDWWGFGNQLRRSQKHIWHWRDWIIESLNKDTPYDEMVRLMLAADELYPNDLDKLRATGYLARNYWLFNRNQWMEETVEHVSKGFLGLMMNCAKCHDHKYDPIEQADFYRLRAFFEPYHVRLDVVPDEPDLTRDGIPRVFDGWLDKPTFRFVRGQEKNPDKSTVITPGIPEILNFKELKIQPVSLPPTAWQPERRSWVIKSHLTQARNKITEAELTVEKAREKLAGVAKSDSATKVQAELNVAEAALAVAIAEHASVEKRSEAMRATWVDAVHESGTDTNNQEKANPEKSTAAIRAERQVLVAKARHAIAVAELALIQSDDKKKDAAEKKLKETRESLKKTMANAEAEIKPTDKYTRLVGAKWTPTRFLFSGKDDPPVEFAQQSTGRRTALAKWITDRRNPLTARVAANHIWMRHMGTPLVSTVFNFGRNGDRPTHPELLDWLAAELMDHGWSMKHLHRLIVTSSAYRMSSSNAGGEENVAKDPDNQYWWRRVPIRLESQSVRDSILAHAGTLDPTMWGPPVPRAQQAGSTRRSIYFFHSNNERNLFLTMFDEARVTECYKREQSIVPQQALALTNSKLVLDASQKIANRLSKNTPDDAEFIRKAFLVLLGIDAGENEIIASKKALEAWKQLPESSAENVRAQLIWALINHNDFVTLR